MVRAEVESGEYASESEVIRDGLRALHTGCLPATSDDEMRKTGSSPPGCDAHANVNNRLWPT